MPTFKEISNEEKVILSDFFDKVKKLLKKNKIIKNYNLDMETFWLILNNTKFKTREYYKIFIALPTSVKIKIMEKIAIKDEKSLKKEFKRLLNIYNQEIKRLK